MWWSLVPAQAVRDLKAAVHGLDSLIGRRGQGRPLPGPLRFKSGPIGQPARGDLPPRHFCVVGIHGLGGRLLRAKVRKRDEMRPERGSHLSLCKSRAGDAAARFKVPGAQGS